MRKIEISASYWKRFLSFLIDIIILGSIVLAPINLLISTMVHGDLALIYEQLQAGTAEPLFAVILVSISILSWLYFTFFTYLLDQTPGMMIIGTYRKSLHGPLTFFQCLLCHAALPFVSPVSILWIIDIGYLMWNNTGQRLTEWLSRTHVVEYTQPEETPDFL